MLAGNNNEERGHDVEREQWKHLERGKEKGKGYNYIILSKRKEKNFKK